jgi:NTP pyrophosphatase (non-canonical NTP hydrolase)
MPDATTTVAALRAGMARFVAERQWEPFHSPKNLVMALAAEAAELLELFLWVDNDASRRVVDDPVRLTAVADEMADVANCLFALSNALGIDLSDAIASKAARNELKYPADRYRGRYELGKDEG